MEILLYQDLVFIIAVIAIILLAFRYKNKKVTLSTFVVSIIILLIIVAIGLYPDATTDIAKIIGFKRGLDLIFVIAIAFLGYLLIKINLKLDSLNHEIDKVVRKIAIDNEEHQSDDDDE
ncbi:hypothetical protein BGI41_04995 [Methanobrevibacter sp. 87.7]|uniref:DUF2304 family protein n=1 Tax=Methanobrevibacter sp. 87.7 TaxID=387957 RepID=UPI000B514B7E|nr:DUF2304 family protein [Methanobrevibacter sp. 87.7]OWT32934.1 hypothetical protein BGI41_04995 [Methanobrevibacter sp. 87.7]